MRSEKSTTFESGFSMVEVVMTLAVAGILLLIAASTFVDLREKYRVEAETKQLYADLMDARARAMQRNRICFVRLAANGYATFEDASPQPDGNGVFDSGADIVCAQASGTHAIDLSGFGGAATFQFDRNGISSRTGTLSFSSTAQPDYDCITIGQTRINMGSISGGICVEK